VPGRESIYRGSPERNFELGAGFGEAEKGVATVAPDRYRCEVPALTLRPGDVAADVRSSDPLVCSGISGRLSTINNSGTCWRGAARAGGRGLTKPVLRRKMPIDTCPQCGLALLGGSTTIGLEIAIEVPDQIACGGLGGAVSSVKVSSYRRSQ